MALEEQGLDMAEHYVEYENLSPYSNTSTYSEPTSYYHGDYDWHQSAQPTENNHSLSIRHAQTMLETERQFFNYQPPMEVPVHTYHPYQHGVMEGSDFYQAPAQVWTANGSDPLSGGTIHSNHRFFSGIDLSQQTRAVGTPTTASGKPKRKRVQSMTQRKAANVRERRRMFHLNEAFDELRKRLPAFNYEKRLSRIETLRLAMTYISFMKDVSVGTDPTCVKLKEHSSDLTDSSISDLLNRSSFEEGEDGRGGEDSDCSNDEFSNHSGGN